MSQTVPWGRQEDLHLEFKSTEALARPEMIGREVVAMLNAEGGEIWVGFSDRNGTAIEVQGVDDPERAGESLLDSLIDSLEPCPLPDEVQVEPVPVSDKISVLRIRVVSRPERRPYALLKSGGRHFTIRVGARIRPMSRGEIFSSRVPGASEGGGSQLDDAIRKVVSERKSQDRHESLSLRLEPAAEIEVDLQSPRFEELVTNPAASGNRQTGFHFARAWAVPELGRDWLRWGYPDLAFEVEVQARGSMLFTAALRTLHWKGEKREIWPLCLLEYPVSAFRLAREIYRDLLAEDDQVVADLSLFGIRGWKLREGSPLSTLFKVSHPVEYPEPDEDLTWTQPLVFRYREIAEVPDRCGFRLVRRVYEAFGMHEESIPGEFDRQSGRLVLTD